MEFTYRISEADYLATVKLRRRSVGRGPLKLFLAWLWILAFLIMLWFTVLLSVCHSAANSNSQVQTASDSDNSVSAAPSAKPSVASLLILRAADLLVLAWFLYPWLVIFRSNGSARFRKLYRQNPQMQGEITMNISPESFSSHNSVGTKSQAGWNIYDHWIEYENMVLLVRRSGAYAALNIAALTEAERAELRSILSAVLPRQIRAKTRLRDFGSRVMPLLKRRLREFIHGQDDLGPGDS